MSPFPFCYAQTSALPALFAPHMFNAGSHAAITQQILNMMHQTHTR